LNLFTAYKEMQKEFADCAAQEKRPEWAKNFIVDDLFAGAETADETARRFRELSKIYHPDHLNNPSGLANLMQHIIDNNPQWLRTACYEAYLLIKDKKEMQ